MESAAPAGVRPGAKEAARRATKAALLEAATELLLASPGADPLAAVRPGVVAHRARPARTTGAFYNIWPSQSDFRRDLLEHVLALDRIQVGERTLKLLAGLIDEEPFQFDEVVRVAATLTFDGLKRDPAMRLKHALWSRLETDTQVRDQLRDFHTSVSESLVSLYAAILARSGRRMRPGYDLSSLTVALTALVEGLHVRWAVLPESVPDHVPPPPDLPPGSAAAQRPWSLFASLCYTTVLAMTQPTAPPDPSL